MTLRASPVLLEGWNPTLCPESNVQNSVPRNFVHNPETFDPAPPACECGHVYPAGCDLAIICPWENAFSPREKGERPRCSVLDQTFNKSISAIVEATSGMAQPSAEGPQLSVSLNAEPSKKESADRLNAGSLLPLTSREAAGNLCLPSYNPNPSAAARRLSRP